MELLYGYDKLERVDHALCDVVGSRRCYEQDPVACTYYTE